MKDHTATREKLEEALLSELSFRDLEVLPKKLVKNTAAILTKMLANGCSYEVIEIIGFGAIWAWALDDYVDNPSVPLKEKKLFLYDSIHLLDSFDLKKEIISDNISKLPYTAILILDCLNKIISYSELNDLDRKLLKEEYKLCLQGFNYDAINNGKKVEIEESLYFRAYSYVPPFYGAMIYACNFHVADQRDYRDVKNFLEVFGEITRIQNDVGSYKREEQGREINIVLLLMNYYNKSEREALAVTSEYLKRAKLKYKEFSQIVANKKFTAIIDDFISVHELMYKMGNVRTLDSKNI